MAIERLSDGTPSVLAIGMYGCGLKTFDEVVTTKLLDELKKLVGVYVVHPFETDYGGMPEVDFTMSLEPYSRVRMLDENPSYRQKYDRGTSFQDVTRSHTRVARIILQEFPWPKHKDALEFAFGPKWSALAMPPQWGKGWFKRDGVYYLYPFVDKQEFRPEVKEDFVFVDCPSAHPGARLDFSAPFRTSLDELGVEYFQGKYPLEERIPREDFVSKMNRAKLYFHVKAESYGLTIMEAIAAEAIVIGTPRTLRTLYINEFGLKTVPTTVVETLKKAITTGLEAYDKPEVQKHLHAMREKLWDYGRLAREIADILGKLKGGGV